IAQLRLFLPRGIQRVPVHTVRPGALRHGDQSWQAAASADGSDAANTSAIDVGRTDELRARLGPQDPDTGGSPSPGCWPQWPFLDRRSGVPSHVPRTRTGGGSNVERFLRGHTIASRENRGGVRGTREDSSGQVMRLPTALTLQTRSVSQDLEPDGGSVRLGDTGETVCS